MVFCVVPTNVLLGPLAGMVNVIKAAWVVWLVFLGFKLALAKGIIIAHARADIFDYIERFDNPRKLRKLQHEKITQSYSINLSVKSG